MKVLVIFFVLSSVRVACQGQSAESSFRFEVASIKPGGDVFSTRPERLLGRFRWTTQLAYLIGYAYDLDFSRISGGRLGTVYTIEATFGAAATDDQVRLMLQSLLVERFQIRAHRMTAQVDGYIITVGKGGAKMKEPAGEGSRPSWCPDASTNAEGFVSAILMASSTIEIRGCRASVSKLAVTLGRNLRQPLWDQTGLQGIYDFDFHYSQDVSTGVETDAPSLATALREDLGLTLQKAKGPLETLVVDSIEQPSGN
jgi:uncharacterized protein (TIGR03435 family)